MTESNDGDTVDIQNEVFSYRAPWYDTFPRVYVGDEIQITSEKNLDALIAALQKAKQFMAGGWGEP
jgi:hypothetical protein